MGRSGGVGEEWGGLGKTGEGWGRIGSVREEMSKDEE